MKHKLQTFLKSKLHRVMALVFLLMLVLNVLTVKISDDFIYSANHGFLDIFYREYVQYMTWTGRSVAHIIDRIFLALPKMIFDICNSLMFCIHVFLIALHATGTKERITPLLYGLIALAIFLFAPLFGQTVLWETGACNYLWTTSIILAFLYQYRMESEQEQTHAGWFPVAMAFFGLAAGWTNENTGGACILLVLFYLAYFLYQKKPIRPWMITGLIGAGVGFALMIIAPGNIVRSADFINTGGKAYNFIHDLMNSIDVFGAADGQILLWTMFAVVLGLTYLFWKKQRNALVLGCFYATAGIAAVLAIIISPVPVYFDRSMYGSTILIITGIAVILYPLLGNTAVKRGSVLALSVMLLFSVFNYARAIVDLSYTGYQYRIRENWVSEQKQAGNLNPVVPTINNEFFTTYNGMFGLNDILEDPAFINNRYYAIDKGLETVTSTGLDKWNNLYRYGNPALMNLWEYESWLKAVKDNPDYALLITSSSIDESYQPLIKTLEETFDTSSEGEGNHLLGILRDGDQRLILEKEPGGMESDINGHYIWMYSADDETNSDILINNVEYTNDNEGISFVVFDTLSNKPVDSITFTASDPGRGNRHYTE